VVSRYYLKTSLRISYSSNTPSFPIPTMSYRTISVKEDLYNLIKDRARKSCRGISSQVEFEFKREQQMKKYNRDNS